MEAVLADLPEADGTDARAEALEARASEVAGVVHASFGALVEVATVALDESLWGGYGIHSPVHWLSWKTGVAPEVAARIVEIARRAEDLPLAIAALRSGELSLDAVALIARHVPVGYDEDAVTLARFATVTQLRRVFPRYAWGDAAKDGAGNGGEDAPAGGDAGDGSVSGQPTSDDPNDRDGDDADPGDDNSSPDAGGDGDDGDAGDGGGTSTATAGSAEGSSSDRADDPSAADAPKAGRPCGHATPVEERRRCSFWIDDQGYGHLSAMLAPDEALRLRAALDAAATDLRLDLTRSESRIDQDHHHRGRVSMTDALMACADGFLAHGRETLPTAGRYRLYAHLDADHRGTNRLIGHLNPVLPDHIRRLLACDGDLQPVWHRHGQPVALGRNHRIVPGRLRRIIEHRDGGCAIPGCPKVRDLHIHHIRHWEDGGTTDPDNLICLCARHHRLHHLGYLGITGRAGPSGPPGAGRLETTDPLKITDRWGRELSSGPTITAPADREPKVAAVATGLPEPRFEKPSGEPLRADAVFFSPNRSHRHRPEPPDRSTAATAAVSAATRSVDRSAGNPSSP